MRQPTKPRTARLGIAMLVMVAALGWYLRSRSTRGDLETLPRAERRAFYARTLEDLQTVCTRTTGADLGDHCRAQARLLVRFPECDAACQRIAQPFLVHPER